MRRKYINIVLLTLLSVSLISPTLLNAQKASDVYTDVSPSVVLLKRAKTSGSNITCVSLEEGLVFIDASLFTELAAKFRKDMEERFKKKTLALLLTHAHTDHFFGMGAFSDVPVIASTKSRERFKFQIKLDYKARLNVFKGIFPRFEEALSSAKIFMPTLWFEKEIKIGGAENYLVFKHTGGHTAGMAIAYFPSEKIAIGGDNVQVDSYPYFGDRTGDVNLWIQSLKNIEELKPDYICPGHGKFVDIEYLKTTTKYFEQLVAALKDLKSKSTPFEEVLHNDNLPKGYWPKEKEEPKWWAFSMKLLYNNIK